MKLCTLIFYTQVEHALCQPVGDKNLSKGNVAIYDKFSNLSVSVLLSHVICFFAAVCKFFAPKVKVLFCSTV